MHRFISCTPGYLSCALKLWMHTIRFLNQMYRLFAQMTLFCKEHGPYTCGEIQTQTWCHISQTNLIYLDWRIYFMLILCCLCYVCFSVFSAFHSLAWICAYKFVNWGYRFVHGFIFFYHVTPAEFHRYYSQYILQALEKRKEGNSNV